MLRLFVEFWFLKLLLVHFQNPVSTNFLDLVLCFFFGLGHNKGGTLTTRAWLKETMKSQKPIKMKEKKQETYKPLL